MTDTCPIVDYNPFLVEPVHAHVRAVDELRAKYRHVRTAPFGGEFHVFLHAAEIRDALQDPELEWHKRIPEYRLPDAYDVREHGGMFGIDNLSLVW